MLREGFNAIVDGLAEEVDWRVPVLLMLMLCVVGGYMLWKTDDAGDVDEYTSLRSKDKTIKIVEGRFVLFDRGTEVGSGSAQASEVGLVFVFERASLPRLKAGEKLECLRMHAPSQRFICKPLHSIQAAEWVGSQD